MHLPVIAQLRRGCSRFETLMLEVDGQTNNPYIASEELCVRGNYINEVAVTHRWLACESSIGPGSVCGARPAAAGARSLFPVHMEYVTLRCAQQDAYFL